MPTEAEVDAMVARGDLGQLADLVLNGDGDRLLNKNSRDPEVQSFLDHVPTYMVSGCARCAPGWPTREH